MPVVPMLYNFLPCLLLFLSHTHAIGIEFTKPGAGATWPSGPITISWQDAGGNPNLADLTTYSLQLMVGGNNPDDSQAIQQIGQDGGQVSDQSVQDEIRADVAESIQNGFYLMMTSNTSSGNQVINYSDRFTLIQMNGTTAPQYLNGANGAAGSVSNVPEAQYNVVAPTTNSATSASSTSSTTGTTSQAASSSPNGSDDTVAHLSTSAVAGLIAGGILALIGLISLIVWTLFFARRFRRRHRTQHAKKLSTSDSSSETGHPSPAFIGHKAELPAQSSSRTELSPTTERYEMHGFGKAVEAPTETVFELEGDVGLYEAGSGRRTRLWDPIE